jgi:hypothetical protein
MKKIRLNVANLEATEVLSREQLKSIFGGSGGSGSSGSTNCSTTCKGTSDTIEIENCIGTCTATDGVSVKCEGPTATLEKKCK